jgi:hypothetical protein
MGLPSRRRRRRKELCHCRTPEEKPMKLLLEVNLEEGTTTTVPGFDIVPRVLAEEKQPAKKEPKLSAVRTVIAAIQQKAGIKPTYGDGIQAGLNAARSTQNLPPVTAEDVQQEIEDYGGIVHLTEVCRIVGRVDNCWLKSDARVETGKRSRKQVMEEILRNHWSMAQVRTWANEELAKGNCPTL